MIHFLLQARLLIQRKHKLVKTIGNSTDTFEI